jgi:hypothetical protein
MCARFAELLCFSVEYPTAESNMSPSADYRRLNPALSLTALSADLTVQQDSAVKVE